MRASQLAAAPQRSSIMISSGALPRDVAIGGFQSGPAAAMMTSAARVSRSSVSHHGVRDGVSSLGAMSNSMRVGGKSIRRGRGGTNRSSHHNTGRLSSPSRMSGLAKARGRPGIMPVSPVVPARASG